MRAVLMIGLLALALTRAARGDTWTNAAGHVIEAELIRLDGNVALFKLADGSRMELPLTSLSAGSRAKAEAEWSRFKVPAEVRGDYDHCVRTLRRLRELREAGRLEANDYALRRQAAYAGLKATCSRLQAEGKLAPQDVERILFLAWAN